MLHHFTTSHLWFVVPISMMCAKVKRLRCKIYIDAFGYLNDMNYLLDILIQSNYN